MAPSWIQLAIVAALLVLLFGRGRISDLMSDIGKGIRSFKKGLSEEDQDISNASTASIKNSSDEKDTDKKQ